MARKKRRRDKYGRFAGRGKSSQPPRRDEYGRFATPGTPTRPPQPRAEGGRFAPRHPSIRMVERALLAQRLQDFIGEQYGVDIVAYERRTIHGLEAPWDVYRVDFLEVLSTRDDTANVAEIAASVLLPHYHRAARVAIRALRVEKGEAVGDMGGTYLTLTSAEPASLAFSRVETAVDQMSPLEGGSGSYEILLSMEFILQP